MDEREERVKQEVEKIGKRIGEAIMAEYNQMIVDGRKVVTFSSEDSRRSTKNALDYLNTIKL